MGRGVLTPLGYPAVPEWGSVMGRWPFMLTPRIWGGRDKWPDDLDTDTVRCYLALPGILSIPYEK